jgi:hypothetical protein
MLCGCPPVAPPYLSPLIPSVAPSVPTARQGTTTESGYKDINNAMQAARELNIPLQVTANLAAGADSPQ